MNRWSKAFLVALRLAVGWHFLYEGLWKINSDTGSTSYAAAWYPLQTSMARFRDYYAQAPPLDAGLARADAWYDDLVKTFKGRSHPLDEAQKARLADLRDKVKLAAYDAAHGRIAPSDVVNFDWIDLRDTVLRIPPQPEVERFSSLPYLQQSVGPLRPLFRGLVHDIDGLERLTLVSAQAALDRRADEILRHYSSAGRPFTPEQQARFLQSREAVKSAIAGTWNDPAFQTRLADYRRLCARVSGDPARVTAPFSRERLAEDRRKLDTISAELLAFVNEPLDELAVQAQALATVGQLAAGPLPRPAEPAGWIDRAICWSLTAIGLCLLLGLFTPVAAAAAALQLAMFYFASPPWPGMPAATLGGHYLYVDRNLIELAAACVIATTGTGRIAGLDAFLSRFIGASHDPQRVSTASGERQLLRCS